VSDGSTDNTLAIARAARVHAIELPFNLGIGGAMRTGFKYAADYGYDEAVQLDADGQHDPRTVRRLLDALDAGADLVVGSRFVEGGTTTYHVGRIRRAAMKILEGVVHWAVRRRFTDTSSGFRGFSRPMLCYFAEHYPVEYMESVESLVAAVNAGFDVREVPAGMFGRTGGAPSTSGWRLAYYYTRLLVVLLISYTRPRHRQRTTASTDDALAPATSHVGISPTGAPELQRSAEGRGVS
jgi:glycosyltransferase involved in cell wall biosynthesis